MNGRLPVVTAGEVVRALERAGFVVVRTSGSHHRLVHKDDPSRATTVSVHAGKTLKRGNRPTQRSLRPSAYQQVSPGL
jgi:predicted RNA binding protein YcfA (HicA-like mRNA interferase family)